MGDLRQAVDEQLLVEAFARLRPAALGVSVGAVAALGLFVQTTVLLVGAALGTTPGGEVGPHLALLGHYFPGYSVSWPGASVGLVYGFATGFVWGSVFALLVNLSHLAYLRVLERRLRRKALDEVL